MSSGRAVALWSMRVRSFSRRDRARPVDCDGSLLLPRGKSSDMTRPIRWFLTTQFEHVTPPDKPASPSQLVHAKEMGTLLTACGQISTSWFKYWEQPFVPGAPGRCSKCQMVVTDSGLLPRKPVRRLWSATNF